MHYLHLIFVEAEDASNAIAKVESGLDEAFGQGMWWDYYTIGGRWDGHVPGNVLCFADDPDKWHALVEDAIKSRSAEVKMCRDSLVEMGMDFDFPIEYDPKGNEMLGYYIKRMGDILGNYWCSDSYAYDMELWTASLKYQGERCDENPTQQFLVVVDFHG